MLAMPQLENVDARDVRPIAAAMVVMAVIVVRLPGVSDDTQRLLLTGVVISFNAIRASVVVS
jgi:hypothetical protein